MALAKLPEANHHTDDEHLPLNCTARRTLSCASDESVDEKLANKKNGASPACPNCAHVITIMAVFQSPCRSQIGTIEGCHSFLLIKPAPNTVAAGARRAMKVD